MDPAATATTIATTPLDNPWSIITGLALGLGLAAACGFRVFVPLLVLAIASRANLVGLGDSMAWLGSWTAIIALGSAATLEIVAYKVPWLDHALDTIATPAAVVAGTLVGASQLGAVGVDPILQWGAGIIAGGGAAGLVQATNVSTRAASTVATAGFLNPFISAGQSIMSVIVSVLAILAPVIAVGVLLLTVATLLVIVLYLARRRMKAGRARLAPVAVAA